ncbi:hypothetical protein ACVD54_004879 [Enterobacter mori]|uniref:hypothetical protein n=1 Tax=Enterobacter mori TaxID=539813 RepID=UPI0028A62D77|nr:hypothetical protein [Enterobacter mori]HED2469827.1 hypothetical protein [Enterobacter mori]HED2472541.1 hypothetical protein [Enterobacter mori]
MKKDSYAFLIPLIVGGLALIFGFVVWSIQIYRVTFLTVLGEQVLAVGALLLPLVVMAMFIAKRAFKGKTVVDVVKIYLGLIIFSLPVVIFFIVTAAWLLGGEYSAWSQPYRYESGGRKSCSGAKVYEPELKREIRICYPQGNYFIDSTLYVEKRSNSLGMVVLWAITRP